MANTTERVHKNWSRLSIKKCKYCRLTPYSSCPCLLYWTSLQHYLTRQAVFHWSLSFNPDSGFVSSSRRRKLKLKFCHWYCLILVYYMSNLLIWCLGMAALMWTKLFLVFLNISRHYGLSPTGHDFLAVLVNVQKSFWMTVECLVSICCQTYFIASTSET